MTTGSPPPLNLPPAPSRHDAVLTRAMGVFFALGSVCFVIGPTTTYARWTGGRWDALTFFFGSILFTLGGLAQCALARPEHDTSLVGLASWRTAWIQSVGTVLFNVMTLEAITVGPADHHYDWVVWPPNVIGSVCFLASGVIFYLSSPRHGLFPSRRDKGWWEPAVNLLGCVLFGVSAGAGFVVGSQGAELSTDFANWTTTLGAACFLLVALTACGLGFTLKAPRMRQLRNLAEMVVEFVGETTGAVVEFADDATEMVVSVEHDVVVQVQEEIVGVRQQIVEVGEQIIEVREEWFSAHVDPDDTDPSAPAPEGRPAP